MDFFKDDSSLVVIDMIRDFADPAGKLYVPGSEKTIPFIAELANEARNRKIPVIFVCDAHDEDDEEFAKWGVHAVKGTDGASIVEGLKKSETDYVIEKKRFSAFYETELQELLKRVGTGHLVITGTVTNICVFVSSVDAIMRGYRVTIPRQGVSALNEEDGKFALDQLSRVFGVEVV